MIHGPAGGRQSGTLRHLKTLAVQFCREGNSFSLWKFELSKTFTVSFQSPHPPLGKQQAGFPVRLVTLARCGVILSKVKVSLCVYMLVIHALGAVLIRT